MERKPSEVREDLRTRTLAEAAKLLTDERLKTISTLDPFTRQLTYSQSEWIAMAGLLRIYRELFAFVDADFIAAVNDIGRYGFEKYKEQSFQHRRLSGDISRGDMPRTLPQAIALHSQEHFDMYLRGELHDHFGTLKHQLAAVAFNAMMEFIFAGLDKEQ